MLSQGFPEPKLTMITCPNPNMAESILIERSHISDGHGLGVRSYKLARIFSLWRRFTVTPRIYRYAINKKNKHQQITISGLVMLSSAMLIAVTQYICAFMIFPIFMQVCPSIVWKYHFTALDSAQVPITCPAISALIPKFTARIYTSYHTFNYALQM